MKQRELIVVALFVFAVLIAALLALVSLPLALLAVVGFASVIVIITSPFSGLIIYTVLLYIRPQDFIPSLEKMRIMLVLAVAIIVSFIAHNILNRKPIHILNPRQNVMLFILLLLVLISGMINLAIKDAWDGFNEFLTIFLLFFIIVNTVDTVTKLKVFCWTLVVCTFLLSLNGILQHFRGYDLIGNTPTGDGRIQWIGIFGDPNDLALLMNSFIPFVLINLFEREIASLKKVLFLLVGVAYVMVIIYTNSRGGFVALIVMVAFFSLKRWGLLKGAVIGVVLLAVLTLISPSRMGDLNPHEESASGRVYAWIDGLVLLKTAPVFGIGYDNFTARHGRAAHSAFIQCLAELGLVGYFFWLALIYTTFRDMLCAERVTTSAAQVKYARIVQLSLVGFLGGAFFLSQAYNPIFYILISLAAVITNLSDQPIPRPRILSFSEILRTIVILGGSIVAYKVLAMLYI